ncbi:hypothetical protein CSQ90_25580 [Janthinobacterium sp. BJB303]|nr:hypothetical protein CSQ90_25580 [Janthinobacterium sp. BJB303]
MTPDSALIDSVIQQIRTYMSRHPHAADTCEGIAQWWVAGECPPCVVDVALQQLHAMGELERVAFGTRQLWRRQQGAR